MPNVYRPRMLAELIVPVAGTAADKKEQDGADSTVTLTFIPRRVTLVKNDHNHADECQLTAEWKDTGNDPRLLDNAILSLYIGNANDGGEWTPGPDDLRFLGVLTKPRRLGAEGQGFLIELEFHDYTQFFLEMKDFPADGVPDYSQTLDDAWRRICDHTGVVNTATGKLDTTVRKLRDSLVPIGFSEWPVLGKAVAARFAKLGKVHVKPNSTAWDVWQQCVGSLGLISYIDKDECIVTTATDYYTSDNPPRLVWGQNIERWVEDRNSTISRTGIGITSFDPLTGTTLEALWPPLGDGAVHRKHLSAKKAHSGNEVRHAESRHYYAYPGVTNPAALLDIARRAYEERSRQDLEGSLVTHEMSVLTDGNDTLDLMSLGSGDVIRVEVDRQDSELLAYLESDRKRIDYLVGRGYREDVAELLVRNMKNYADLDSTFFVKRVNTTLETSGDGGTFSVEINYVNRIQTDGSASKK